jgi:uncharacterized protein YndB with AHSA1/START domain
MNTSVATPNELEIRVERLFDPPRAHVFSVWTDPKLIPDALLQRFALDA